MELDKLNGDILRLEKELDRKYEEQGNLLIAERDGAEFVFDPATISKHKEMRTPLVPYFLNSSLRVHLTSPFVYGMIIPLVFLDLSVVIFQAICFRAWDISAVRRADYVSLDRRHLAYLNGIEKLNCVFCGYANGVISFIREVAGRTEQYWCPIKHARKMRDQHVYYKKFIDYGDADGWRENSRYPHLRH